MSVDIVTLHTHDWTPARLDGEGRMVETCRCGEERTVDFDPSRIPIPPEPRLEEHTWAN